MALTHDHAIHDNGKGDPEAGRWRKGEPVDLIEARDGRLIPSSDPAFHIVYATDWPGTVLEAKAALLTEHVNVNSPAVDKPMVARRRFVLPDDTGLNRDRIKVMTWAELSGALKERQTAVRDIGAGTLAEALARD